jgi:hypothetical protein
MSEFSHTITEVESERLLVEKVLGGVRRMLERMRVQEAPKDPVEKRGHYMAFATAVNALCRGEWQR